MVKEEGGEVAAAAAVEMVVVIPKGLKVSECMLHLLGKRTHILVLRQLTEAKMGIGP